MTSWKISVKLTYNLDSFICKWNLTISRCSAGITGINAVVKCQGGSCITRPCRQDPQTGLFEAKCAFIPDRSQTSRESIMFMQSLDSVSTVFSQYHKIIFKKISPFSTLTTDVPVEM